MALHDVHLLDLPNEILFRILKKLDNMDVLYSLLGINNQRLDNIAQEKTFTTILNFVSMSSNDDVCSISGQILNRFYCDILPRIHYNVKCLILESNSMEHILLAGNYPNLTSFKLFNFNKEILSRYFLDDSLFRHICKQQITDLTLISNENNSEITLTDYTMNVYLIILSFFKNLKHLSILSSSIDGYPPLSLHNLPSTIFSSSTLTKLCINVNDFGDCLALLDGRLKQLTTFIVQIKYIENVSLQSYDMDDLPDLKSFSLICYSKISEYDNLVVRLLHHMSHLEELTLYLCIKDRPRFVDGTHIHNEILSHMTRLHTFTFYISTENYVKDSTLRLSNNDIQETFKNRENQQVDCTVDYVDDVFVLCKIFSLPFRFDRFEWITNNFSTMIFNPVTYLILFDRVSFKHEFFVRVARAFPLLKYLSVHNIKPPFWRFSKPHLVDNYSPIAEYLHLISLHFGFVSNCYVDQFLNETKTSLPRLIKLKVNYRQLKSVTENFTRNETQRNCAMVKRLIIPGLIVFPEDVYRYFPSL
ncbi:unnamed protein product [Rotaria magnacalcarata]